MVFSQPLPKEWNMPTWEFKRPPRVPDGLPELLRAIADAQATLAATKPYEDTERGRVVLRTQKALARLVEIWAEPMGVLTTSNLTERADGTSE